MSICGVGRYIEVLESDLSEEIIALILPGLNYPIYAPLFYYISRIMDKQKIKCIYPEFNWNKLNESNTKSKDDLFKIVEEEIQSAIKYINTKYKSSEKILIAKSVGTLVSNSGKSIKDIFKKEFYFTPIVNIEQNTKRYVYIGEMDKYLSEQRPESKANSQFRVYPNLDHSLNVGNDYWKSLEGLMNVLNDFEKDLET